MTKRKRNQAHAPEETATGEVGPSPDQKDRAEGSWSKSKKKRMRRLRSKAKYQQMNKTPGDSQNERTISGQAESDENPPIHPQAEQAPLSKHGSLQNKQSSLIESFKARLSGSRFRSLNEELYTTPSQESFQRFTKDPALFQEYHDGFRHQVNSWPVNPVTVLCKKIIKYAHKKRRNLPQDDDDNSSLDDTNKEDRIDNKTQPDSSTVVVADFGCGEAQLAAELLSNNPKRIVDKPEKPKKDKRPESSDLFRVHSFDLVAPAPGVKTRDLVTPCDMARVPLAASCVDVGVFCLSLMGTNLADFIREAHRVLKSNGTIWIAEVQSRFFDDSDTSTAPKKSKTKQSRKSKTAPQHHEQHSNDKQLQDFLQVLDGLGFRCIHKDFSNKMFFVLQLVKNGKKPDKKKKYTAKPCIYKRR